MLSQSGRRSQRDATALGMERQAVFHSKFFKCLYYQSINITLQLNAFNQASAYYFPGEY